MAKENLFTETAIKDSTNPAFHDIYDGYIGDIKPNELANFAPIVIGSPKKTGKTTQVYRVHNRHQQIFPQSKIPFIEIEGTNMSEDDFRENLKEVLESRRSSTLLNIIESSKLIAKERYIVLAIIDTHKFKIDTIKWLLRGIMAIKEGRTPSMENKLQIIIDGSFAVDTLTFGPNSEFPMSQIYPREFRRNEQENFIQPRLKAFNLELEPLAYRAIWDATLGDKYFTQILSHRLSRDSQDLKITVNESKVIDCVESYIRESVFDDSLKPYLFNSFFKFSTFCKNNFLNTKNLITNISNYWENLPKEIRGCAYDGGLVKRKNESEIELRSPIIINLLKYVLNKADQVETILNSFFSLSGVRKDFFEKAKDNLDEIRKAAYLQKLKTLHVGFGNKVTDSEVKIKAAALGHGIYEGTWNISTDNSIRYGDEVWGLMWSYENKKGEVQGKINIFPFSLDETT